MARLRSFLFGHRGAALALILAALAVRIAVPAGMMPGAGPGGATLVVCSGQMAMAGMAMPDATGHPGKADPAKADAPCAFTGLIAAAIDAGAWPALPAIPLPATGLAVAALAAILARTLRLRPPSHGPPVRAA